MWVVDSCAMFMQQPSKGNSSTKAVIKLNLILLFLSLSLPVCVLVRVSFGFGWIDFSFLAFIDI
jgi:hypothetical protein